MRFLDTSRVRVRLDRRFSASDGTELSIDLYLPPVPGHYPVLLHRTAADNNRFPRVIGSLQMLPGAADRWKAFAAQGFIVATADVRGRGDSDGAFLPFANEGADGAATVEWLRKLPECNGRVGVFGTGYAAFCAWAAIAAGGRIDAIASISPFGAVGEGLVHRGGAVRLDWLFWLHLVGGRTLQPAALPPWPRIHRHLPLRSMNLALGRFDIPWGTWLEHLDPEDPFWAPVRIADALARRPVPGLHVTGWWDSHLAGARYYYEASTRSGAPQSLIIGPWDSSAVRHPTPLVGGLDFGPRSLIDIDETLARYFTNLLANEAGGGPECEKRLFISGRNEWVNAAGWPKSTGCVREFYITSNGSANTRRGEGSLTDAPLCSEATDEVIHNPKMPIEFQQNFTSFAANSFSLSLEQSHITARDEALVYTSSPLSSALTICGRPSVTITVRSAAPDADLYVLLSDVFPLESRDVHLSHGAVRLATVRGFKPGKVIGLTLELDEIFHDFLPAHCVRVTLVPSLFPLYARNPQQADYVNATDEAITVISALYGKETSSCLRLPIAKF